MKQFKLLDGFYYRGRYIPALDYTIEDFGNERYLTGMNGNVPVSIKLTPGLEEALEQQLNQ
jgi:hypothetical protein